LPERADRLPQLVGYFVAGYASLAPEGRGKSARLFHMEYFRSLHASSPRSARHGRRAAALDRAHHLHLAEAQMAGIGTTPSRSVVPKDIRNLQNWTRHDRRGLCGGGSSLGSSLLGHQRREATVGQLLAAPALPLTDSTTTRAATFAKPMARSEFLRFRCCVIGHSLERERRDAHRKYTQGCAPDPSDRNMNLRIGSLCLDVCLVSQMSRP
jgi:hypothetical protein